MHIVRQLLGNHNRNQTSSSASASTSPASHQQHQQQQLPKQSGMHKRGKSYGGSFSWGGGLGVDDNSSTTTGITEFSRSMSRDTTSLPLHRHDDILEESCGDNNNHHSNGIYKKYTVNDGVGNNDHLRPRSSSFDAKKSPVLSSTHHPPNSTSTHHRRSRSSTHNNSKRKKKNKDGGITTIALVDRKMKKESHPAQNYTACSVAPPPAPHTDTIEFINLKDPAPINPTTVSTKEEEIVEVEEYVMALLEEYQHEIKRLERLNTTLTANLETLTAAALLNGDENNGSTTTTSTAAPAVTPQPCSFCSHCSGGGGTSNPPRHGESFASSSPSLNNNNNNNNSDIYNDMILTETHYLSKISKLQKSNHKLSSELERKKKLISQLLLNLSMAADKIKKLSSSTTTITTPTSSSEKKNMNNEREGTRLGEDHSTRDGAFSNGDGNIVGDTDGGRTNDEASSMQQIRQYQIQVVENELQSLLQVMNTRSAFHAQRRHTLIDKYRHGDSGADGHHNMEKRRLETPEEILQRVIRNLRSGGDGELTGQHTVCTAMTSTTGEPQQKEEEEKATLPPPSPVAIVMLANEVLTSSNSVGGANVWDSVTSLFYGSSQPHLQASPQRHEKLQLQLQPEEGVPRLEIQGHPLCEDVKSFDKNCLKKISPTANTIGWGHEEVEERSTFNGADATKVECSVTALPLPPSDTAPDSFVARTGSSDGVSPNLALIECREDINDVVKAANVDCCTRVIGDVSSEDIHCNLKSGVIFADGSRSIGFFAAEEEEEEEEGGGGGKEDAGTAFIADMPVLPKGYPTEDIREVVDGSVIVKGHGDSIDMKCDVIERSSISCKAEVTSSEAVLEDDGNVCNVPESCNTDTVNSSHDEDDTDDVYTAKEPKDEGDSLEHACVRAGNIEGRNIDCIQENDPIVHVGCENDDRVLFDVKDGHGEINEKSGFDNSYIGTVSLSIANMAPERNSNNEDVIHRAQRKDDKPDESSTFERSLMQLPSTLAHDGLNGSLESMTLSSIKAASTPTTSITRNSTKSIDIAAVELVEKMVVGNKTLSETLGTLQGKKMARFDGSIDDLSMMYHHSITSFYKKPSLTNSYGDDSLSVRLGRRQLFQHHGSLDLSDIRPDVYGDWQILVKSKDNDKYFVPRYKTPVLPPQPVNRAVPLFKKGLKDGHYRYASSSGNEYSGHWVNGKRHGYGMANYHDGEIYHGQWRRGRRHGHGVLHLSNSEVFDGYWSANKKHGLGMYFWTDGEVDISWYQDDLRLESLRWTSDRRRAYRLDLTSSKKEQISLARAADLVRDWERKRETEVD